MNNHNYLVNFVNKFKFTTLLITGIIFILFGLTGINIIKLEIDYNTGILLLSIGGLICYAASQHNTFKNIINNLKNPTTIIKTEKEGNE